MYFYFLLWYTWFIQQLGINMSLENICKRKYVPTSKNKNALYVGSTTLRNFGDISKYLELANIITSAGVDSIKGLQVVLEDSVFSNTNVDTVVRRFQEISKMGLISFRKNGDSFKIGMVKKFNSLNDSQVKDFSFYRREVISNLTLFLLKKENTLDSIVNILSDLEVLAPAQSESYLTHSELVYIYQGLSLWKESFDNYTGFIAADILKARGLYKKLINFNHSAVKNTSYCSFLKTRMEELKKSSQVKVSLPYETISSYISLTMNVLALSGCFIKSKKSYFGSKVVVLSVNKSFLSKLSFFTINDFSEIQELVSKDKLQSSLYSFEKYYLFNNEGVYLAGTEPYVYRFTN